MADSSYCRAFGFCQKFRFSPGEYFKQLLGVEPVSGAEILFAGQFGKTIPWADELAVVAAIDAVADQRP